MNQSIIEIFKIIILVSILFVWVIRYQNIIQEFKVFGYPDWLRDFIGILKISCAVMMMSSNVQLVQIGSFAIAALMISAIFTHVRIKNHFIKMLPSISLMSLSLIVFISTLMF